MENNSLFQTPLKHHSAPWRYLSFVLKQHWANRREKKGEKFTIKTFQIIVNTGTQVVFKFHANEKFTIKIFTIKVKIQLVLKVSKSYLKEWLI